MPFIHFLIFFSIIKYGTASDTIKVVQGSTVIELIATSNTVGSQKLEEFSVMKCC